MSEIASFLAWEWINISLEYAAAFWLRLPRFFRATCSVNLLTHPLFTLALPFVGYELPVLLLCETVIFLVEAGVLTLIYGRARWRLALLASLLMNGTSFLTGLLIM